MGLVEQLRSERTIIEGTEIRDGQIFAQNRGGHVEDDYPVAYNIGCGRKKWSGWIGVDATDGADLVCDIRKLAIESDTADAVAAIHVVEHFYQWEVAPLLTEWMRVLKPGGKMILELPCMDKVFGYIAECVVKKENRIYPFMTQHALWGDPKHKDPLMCHKWGWFQTDLINVLESIGMKDVRSETPRYHYGFRDMRITGVK